MCFQLLEEGICQKKNSENAYFDLFLLLYKLQQLNDVNGHVWFCYEFKVEESGFNSLKLYLFIDRDIWKQTLQHTFVEIFCCCYSGTKLLLQYTKKVSTGLFGHFFVIENVIIHPGMVEWMFYIVLFEG